MKTDGDHEQNRLSDQINWPAHVPLTEEIANLLAFQLRRILTDPVAPAKFPTFCGALVGMYTFFQFPVRMLLNRVAATLNLRTDSRLNITISRLVAAFCAAWLSLQILNTPTASQRKSQKAGLIQEIYIEDGGPLIREEKVIGLNYVPLAGKTMDLTLFAVTRSLESAIGELWSRHKVSRRSVGKWTRLEASVSRFTDASMFAVSSGMIMWAWFYYPNTLPPAYDKWIGGVAEVDRRLIEILRKIRADKVVYGPGAQKHLELESMCKDYNCPLDWADPAKTFPTPCELVHSGSGPSCCWHAAVRFSRAFKIAVTIYLPLQLFLKMRKPSLEAVSRALLDALRSSAFLGAFVGLFWSGVCLSRTGLGPELLSTKMVTPSMWDQGLCIRAGCLLCGWSILIEAAKRRQEVASFVAPKAAATLFPRSYDRKVCSFIIKRRGSDANNMAVFLARENSLFFKRSYPLHICP